MPTKAQCFRTPHRRPERQLLAEACLDEEQMGSDGARAGGIFLGARTGAGASTSWAAPMQGKMASMEVSRDGRTWRVGTASDVAWLAERPGGTSVVTAMPLVFEAYATLYVPDGAVPVHAHERAIVDALAGHDAPQPWWLGYLDTGAHDIAFPEAPLVSLYFDWRYALVEGGPSQATRWRVGHMRSSAGSLPDLFFPFDRSWFVTALWDDAFACIGGSADLIEALAREPLAGVRRINVTEDMTPPGAPRD